MSLPRMVRVAGCVALAAAASTLILAFVDGAGRPDTTREVPRAGRSSATRVRSINVKGLHPDDQFINNTTLQETIKSHNIPYLRIPFRDGWTDAQYTNMVQAVTNAGAIPVAIIHGACRNSVSVSDHY